MLNLVFFVEQIAPGLYILCGLGILWWGVAYFRARQALAGAQFELERELGQYRVKNAITGIVVSIELGLAVVALATVVAPTLRAHPPQITSAITGPEETPFVTAVPGALPGSGTDVPSFAEGAVIPELESELNLQPFATPTLTPTPVGTIIPDVPPPIGCDTPDAQLIIPANGMVVFEALTIIGTANTTDFAFYRFELNGPSTNNSPAKLSEYTIPVVDGALGQIVPSLLIPGEYRFKLAVFDITNTQRASCELTIIISEPIPTPTPLRES